MCDDYFYIPAENGVDDSPPDSTSPVIRKSM